MRKKNVLKTINTAFILRNIKNLSFEEKVVSGGHLATLFFSFFPWVSMIPIYGNEESFNAFTGPARLMGWLVWLMSLAGLAFFIDKIWQKNWLKFSISTNVILGFISFQQVILLICIWSVLLYFGQNFEDSETRFALLACFFAQVLAFVFNYLQMEKGKMKETQDFFQMPAKKSAEKHD